MTPNEVMSLVAQIERSSSIAVLWLRRFEIRPTAFYCEQECIDFAVAYARMAGHYANQLIDLAERGEAA